MFKKIQSLLLGKKYLSDELFEAVRTNYTARVKKLIEDGAEIENLKFDEHKEYNILMYAVENQNIEIIELLLKNGANIEIQNYMKQTALYLAVSKNNFQIVNLLLEKGANVDHQDLVGMTALTSAFFYKTELDIEIIEILAKKSKNLDLMNRSEETALSMASYINLEIMDILHKNGASFNVEDNKHLTLLMRANEKCLNQPLNYLNSNINSLNNLIKEGADINFKNKLGQTAIMNIKMTSQIFTADDIIGYENELGESGSIEFKTFFKFLYEDLFRNLLYFGADLFIRDNNGRDIYEQIMDSASQGLEENEIKLYYYESLQKERKVIGKIIETITGFGGKMIEYSNPMLYLPSEIQHHIMRFTVSLINSDKLIAPNIILKLEDNLKKENLGSWREKKPGEMTRKLLTDSEQVIYRNNRFFEKFSENDEEISNFNKIMSGLRR